MSEQDGTNQGLHYHYHFYGAGPAPQAGGPGSAQGSWPPAGMVPPPGAPGAPPPWPPFGPGGAGEAAQASGPAGGNWHRHPGADSLVKGLVIGAGAAYLLTNETAQRTLMRTAVQAWAVLQSGLEELKERLHDAEAEVAAAAAPEPDAPAPAAPAASAEAPTETPAPVSLSAVSGG